jgi:hypothetical protein
MNVWTGLPSHSPLRLQSKSGDRDYRKHFYGGVNLRDHTGPPRSALLWRTSIRCRSRIVCQLFSASGHMLDKAPMSPCCVEKLLNVKISSCRVSELYQRVPCRTDRRWPCCLPGKRRGVMSEEGAQIIYPLGVHQE